jgi:hypothetical protein
MGKSSIKSGAFFFGIFSPPLGQTFMYNGKIGGEEMAPTILSGLRNMREDLLRQLVLANRSEKAEIFARIFEVEDLIDSEEKALLD